VKILDLNTELTQSAHITDAESGTRSEAIKCLILTAQHDYRISN